VLTSGEEKVITTFESRFSHGKLPSKLLFTYAVLNKMCLLSLNYGIVHINNNAIYVTNEVLISQHNCLFEQYINDLNITKHLANCKLLTKSCKVHPYTKNYFATLYCTKKPHRLLGGSQCHCALRIRKDQQV
jgi:hypothetical protein